MSLFVVTIRVGRRRRRHRGRTRRRDRLSSSSRPCRIGCRYCTTTTTVAAVAGRCSVVLRVHLVVAAAAAFIWRVYALLADRACDRPVATLASLLTCGWNTRKRVLLAVQRALTQWMDGWTVQKAE
ncbi:hypothetical protein SYNPS1DRAFT_31892 [Syncephalis pseudoplumigaleata]|uniref:Uncharacterized protein n=1 Tax=Syncephalis pseudoplumigaleata TaxID=1712513 RepID=A0A4P9YS37_9FUNG|nr:hypothetical protein SYNPS1DRAFT_31892 [Syncephalis pseudoplumigaleata]|eukprot:RKP22505.1 hypothetical protein SYNPS1DRAFT_31892 [Syncephalis pseudoplumigaleata]